MVTNNSANNKTGASGKVLMGQGVGTASDFSTATYPSTAGSSGKILISDGTNIVSSTPTYPNAASPTSRKIIVSDGTNWTASTETYAVPGTSGNVMTSDGTNWTSSSNLSYSSTTWTPTLTGGGTAGTTTYTNQDGWYTKIGSIVHLWGHIKITAATGTGDARIGALPFTANSTSNFNSQGSCLISATGWTWPTGGTSASISVNPGQTNTGIQMSGSTKANQPLQMTNAAFEIWFTLIYST